MPIPALEREIESLRIQLVVWTVVVAVGLAVEYAKDIKDFLVGAFNWVANKGNRPKLSKIVIGGLLITIGVVMEGWVEFRSSRIETQLARANEDELQSSRERVANAEKETVKLRIELARLTAPRMLAGEHRANVVSSLKKFSGQRFSIGLYPAPEPRALALQIDSILKSAGWVRIPIQFESMVVPLSDINASLVYSGGLEALIGSDNNKSIPAWRAFCDVASQEGVPCASGIGELLKNKRPEAIFISVGLKQ